MLRRRRGDTQPTAPVRVVLASYGERFSYAALRKAADLADGGAVAVLHIARIHGSAMGLPNPGLMPNAEEKQAALDNVRDAIAELEARGLTVDGQVAVTRKIEKKIAGVALVRGADYLVIDDPGTTRARAWVEGNSPHRIQRLVGDRLEVVCVPHDKPLKAKPTKPEKSVPTVPRSRRTGPPHRDR